MRNALVLLVAIALLILVAGGLNNSVALDIDYVAGTVTAVSLFWVSAVIAAIVFVAGSVAAWLAQSATTGTRRKLEAELQTTFERLREAEALAARRAPAAPAPESAPVEPAREAEREEGTAVTVSATPTATAEAQTTVADEAQTAVADEGRTAVTAVVVAGEEADEDDPDGGDPVETGSDAAEDPPA